MNGPVDHQLRHGLAQASGYQWEAASWQATWDYGLLWTFLANWIDLIAAIPDSVWETRYEQFITIWLNPLREAAARRGLPEA